MWIDNTIFKEDLDRINRASFIDWEKFEQKTFFVTGGTGLIGYTFICALLYRNLIHHSRIHVIVLVRDMKNAQEQFKSVLSDSEGALKFVSGSIEAMPHVGEHIDFILHAGGPTASRYFAEYPVETVRTIISGMMNALELAKEHQVSGMAFLSTMEVYGASTAARKISETSESYLDTMNARNSYPEAKRLSENLCASYAEEYQVPVNVLRLTQTFGPGIARNDQRVFAEFIRSALEKKDIILLTEGKTKRSYLYTADAVTAILTVLQNICAGQAFNAANEKTFCSIHEMAELVADELSKNEIRVLVHSGKKEEVKAFMPTMQMNLNTARLNRGGWQPEIGLKDMFRRTMDALLQEERAMSDC